MSVNNTLLKVERIWQSFKELFSAKFNLKVELKKFLKLSRFLNKNKHGASFVIHRKSHQKVQVKVIIRYHRQRPELHGQAHNERAY